MECVQPGLPTCAVPKYVIDACSGQIPQGMGTCRFLLFTLQSYPESVPGHSSGHYLTIPRGFPLHEVCGNARGMRRKAWKPPPSSPAALSTIVCRFAVLEEIHRSQIDANLALPRHGLMRVAPHLFCSAPRTTARGLLGTFD